MAFNLKSLGNIANALLSTKDILTDSSEHVSAVKSSKETNQTTAYEAVEMFPERIEKLIRLALAEGELDSDSIEMLERAAVKEGLDPDEVVFVAKKRLKQFVKSAPVRFSPAQKLATALNELDAKFNSAIEALRMGDSSGASAILDTISGGMTGLAFSIGNKIFGKSVDEKVEDIMKVRDTQRSNLISSTTLPNNELQVIELLEFVSTQVHASKSGDKGLLDYAIDSVFGNMDTSQEKNAWKSLHMSAYNRAQMMVAGDAFKLQYIETLKPVKKKFGLF